MAPSSSWDPTRGQDAPTLAGRGFPVTLLPGRGIVRSLGPPGPGRQPRRRSASWRWRPCRAVGLVGPGPAPGGGVGRRLRQPGRLARRRWCTGCRWCWSTWTPCPVRPTGCSAGSPRASAVGWEGTPLPRAVVTGTPVRPADRRRGPVRRGAAGGPGRARAARPTGRWWPSSAARSGARRINQAVDGLAERVGGAGRRGDLPHRRPAGLGRLRPPSRAPTGSPAAGGRGRPPAGPVLVRVPYEERMDRGLRRRRPGGLPGRGHDRGRAGGGRRAGRAGAAARAPRATTRRPTPGSSSGPGRPCCCPTPSAPPAGLTTVVDGLLADPGRLAAMGRAARALGRPDAAAAGAGVVEANAAPAAPRSDGRRLTGPATGPPASATRPPSPRSTWSGSAGPA